MYFNVIEFGKRVQKARRNAGFTQEHLAEMLGVNRTHVTKMERGDRACSVDFLVELSTALNVSSDYLLTGAEDPCSVKYKLKTVIAMLQEIQNAI